MKLKGYYSRNKYANGIASSVFFYTVADRAADQAWTFQEAVDVREFSYQDGLCPLDGYPDLMPATPLAKLLVIPVFVALPPSVRDLFP